LGLLVLLCSPLQQLDRFGGTAMLGPTEGRPAMHTIRNRRVCATIKQQLQAADRVVLRRQVHGHGINPVHCFWMACQHLGWDVEILRRAYLLSDGLQR